MVDTNFYRAFEDRYRGSRELIKSRLTVYLPFVLPLKQFDGACQGIDLGCGRGEWLELMQQNGIDVQGVDLDQGMLDVARERGLDVRHGDAIQYLQSLASGSQTLVSGFHLAEHLPFDVLQVLAEESLRVLKPGGLLILETPNPENIVVGTTNFYLDPTHQRPIPPLLLSFMLEHYGFERVKTLRLQEPVGLAGNNALNLLNVFNGVSQDYAVAAQKGGDSEALAATTYVFSLDYGLTLENLATSYDQQIKSISHHAEAKARHAETAARHAETVARHAETVARHAETVARHAETVSQQAETKAAEQEQRALVAETRITNLLNSTSWKITTPLRMISNTAKILVSLIHMAKSKIKEKTKLLLVHTKLYINRRPRLNRLAFILLSAFPALKRRLKQATAPRSLSNTMPPSVISDESRSALRKSLISAAARWQVGKRVNVQK